MMAGWQSPRVEGDDPLCSAPSPSTSGGRLQRSSPCGGTAATEASLMTAAERSPHDEFSCGSGARRTPYRTLSPSPKEDGDPPGGVVPQGPAVAAAPEAQSAADGRDPQDDSPARKKSFDAEDEASVFLPRWRVPRSPTAAARRRTFSPTSDGDHAHEDVMKVADDIHPPAHPPQGGQRSRVAVGGHTGRQGHGLPEEVSPRSERHTPESSQHRSQTTRPPALPDAGRSTPESSRKHRPAPDRPFAVPAGTPDTHDRSLPREARPVSDRPFAAQVVVPDPSRQAVARAAVAGESYPDDRPLPREARPPSFGGVSDRPGGAADSARQAVTRASLTHNAAGPGGGYPDDRSLPREVRPGVSDRPFAAQVATPDPPRHVTRAAVGPGESYPDDRREARVSGRPGAAATRAAVAGESYPDDRPPPREARTGVEGVGPLGSCPDRPLPTRSPGLGGSDRSGGAQDSAQPAATRAALTHNAAGPGGGHLHDRSLPREPRPGVSDRHFAAQVAPPDPPRQAATRAGVGPGDDRAVPREARPGAEAPTRPPGLRGVSDRPLASGGSVVVSDDVGSSARGVGGVSPRGDPDDRPLPTPLSPPPGDSSVLSRDTTPLPQPRSQRADPFADAFVSDAEVPRLTVELQRCKHCGRGFSGDRIAKHEGVCLEAKSTPFATPRNPTPQRRQPTPTRSGHHHDDGPMRRDDMPTRSPSAPRTDTSLSTPVSASVPPEQSVRKSRVSVRGRPTGTVPKQTPVVQRQQPRAQRPETVEVHTRQRQGRALPGTPSAPPPPVQSPVHSLASARTPPPPSRDHASRPEAPTPPTAAPPPGADAGLTPRPSSPVRDSRNARTPASHPPHPSRTPQGHALACASTDVPSLRAPSPTPPTPPVPPSPVRASHPPGVEGRMQVEGRVQEQELRSSSPQLSKLESARLRRHEPVKHPERCESPPLSKLESARLRRREPPGAPERSESPHVSKLESARLRRKQQLQQQRVAASSYVSESDARGASMQDLNQTFQELNDSVQAMSAIYTTPRASARGDSSLLHLSTQFTPRQVKASPTSPRRPPLGTFQHNHHTSPPRSPPTAARPPHAAPVGGVDVTSSPPGHAQTPKGSPPRETRASPRRDRK
eukprot:Hpha_TRINITY_DN16603_c3_g14::TRINITY_DN16603_c3_g14_i1::g.183113::m.183113